MGLFLACALSIGQSAYLRKDGLHNVPGMLALHELFEVELLYAPLVISQRQLVQQALNCHFFGMATYRVNFWSAELREKVGRVVEAVELSAVVPECWGISVRVGGASCTEVVITSTGYSSALSVMSLL